MASARAFGVHHAAGLSGPLPSNNCIFYTHALCPYAQRVFMALSYKAVPFDLVQVDLSDKPHWYHSVNPQGLVPAVVYNDISYTESMNICRWLDAEFPRPPLTPSSPSDRQLMETLLNQTSNIISAGLSLVAGSTARSWGIGSKPSKLQKQRFQYGCQQMTQALQQTGGPFLTGATPSLADIALLPFFKRFQIALLEFQAYDLGQEYDGALLMWMDNLEQQQWCKPATPDEQLFLKALKTHKSLDFFDFVSYEASSCHPQLQ